MTPSLDGDGYVLVRGLLGPAGVEAILAALEALRATPPEQRPAGERTESGTRHLYELDARIPAVADLVASPRLTDLVTIALGGPTDADQISARTPQPGFGGQRLHADAPPRLDTGPCAVVTAIVALCAIDDTNRRHPRRSWVTPTTGSSASCRIARVASRRGRPGAGTRRRPRVRRPPAALRHREPQRGRPPGAPDRLAPLNPQPGGSCGRRE